MLTGSCLCGTVRYEVEGEPLRVWHCHCRMCRKEHGAAFATYARYPPERVRVTSGAETVRAYRSSAEVERRFCGACGSSLFWIGTGKPPQLWVTLGTLDGDPGRHPEGHLFAASQAPWAPICDTLPRYEESEPPQKA